MLLPEIFDTNSTTLICLLERLSIEVHSTHQIIAISRLVALSPQSAVELHISSSDVYADRNRSWAPPTTAAAASGSLYLDLGQQGGPGLTGNVSPELEEPSQLVFPAVEITPRLHETIENGVLTRTTAVWTERPDCFEQFRVVPIYTGYIMTRFRRQ